MEIILLDERPFVAARTAATVSGKSVFHLQRVLGHSSLEMTRRYANLMTEDLQAIHQRVSLLAV
jgi:site-specific recombinase XerD